MHDEFQSLMVEFRDEAAERGVPMWVVAREWSEKHRELAEDDIDLLIVDEMEGFVMDQFGDEPGWKSE